VVDRLRLLEPTRPGTRRALSAACLIAASAALAFTAAAEGATRSTRWTPPPAQRYVYLLINDHGIALHNTDPRTLTRNQYFRFFVINQSKKTAQFSIEGRTTPRIRPGGSGQTPWILFNAAGKYRYFDPLDKRLSGYIRVLANPASAADDND
jgi:hypothetical protein